MFYQLLDLVIRHVLTWDLQRLLVSFPSPCSQVGMGFQTSTNQIVQWSVGNVYGKRDLQQVLAIFMALKRDSKIE